MSTAVMVSSVQRSAFGGNAYSHGNARIRTRSMAPISAPSGIASSMASAPAASMVHAFIHALRIAPAAPGAVQRPMRRSAEAQRHSPLLDGFHQLFGARAPWVNTTLARWAMRSTRADSTPSVERSASSTWCWQAAHVMPSTGKVTDSVCGSAKWLTLRASGSPRNSDRNGRDSLPSESRRERDRQSADPGQTLIRAAPSRTSFTSNPSVASAWLTRRTQAPQCIPSICNVNSAMIYPSKLMIVAGEGCRRCLNLRNGWIQVRTMACWERCGMG